MIIEVKLPEEKKPELKFPLLVKGKKNGLYYQFKNETTAYCLDTADLRRDLIHLECSDWEILPPGTQVILTQE